MRLVCNKIRKTRKSCDKAEKCCNIKGEREKGKITKREGDCHQKPTSGLSGFYPDGAAL